MQTIRVARATDATGIAEVQHASAHRGFAGLSDPRAMAWVTVDRLLDRIVLVMEEPAPTKTWVWETEAQIAGFAVCGGARDPDGVGSGELRLLYVHPDFWSQGIGSALHDHALGGLRESGFSRVILWCLSGNSGAERFYRKRGWRPDGTRRRDMRTGQPVAEFRMVHLEPDVPHRNPRA